MSWQDIDPFSLGSGFSGVKGKAPVAMPPGRGMVAANLDLRVLELLTARLCHELSGPIAAINNGVELLADEPVLTGGGVDPEASGAGQLHPRALSEPDVILSHHPAPIVRPRP